MKWEVRTMRSGTSFFNVTVWKKTVLRFWPIWAVGLVFWVLALPAQGMMALQRQLENGGDWLLSFSASVDGLGGDTALSFAVVFGLLAAMAVCSHLYSSRSANFMGALPVRREGLFVSHYTAGLSMLLLPNIVVFLLTLLVEALGGAVMWPPLMFWLTALSGMEFFFYSFAVCIGMFTGHLLALPIFYAVFNALAAALRWLLDYALLSFYYGYSSNYEAGEAMAWLTPVLQLARSVEPDDFWSSLGTVGIYALTGLVLTVGALLLYRRRNLETAGDVVAVRVMRPVFQYGVAICAGRFFGTATAGMLGMGTAGMMAAMVVWAVAGYFVARMLLDKTFRVFRCWKGAVAVVAVFIALFLVVGFDLTGYETRVPDPAQVASVEIGRLRSEPNDDGSFWYGVVTEDQEEIALVTQLHQAVVDHREVGSDSQHYASPLNLTYHMKDGTTLVRSYVIYAEAQESEQPGTTAYALERLLADRDLVWQAYGLDDVQAILEGGGQMIAAHYSLSGDRGQWPETVSWGEDGTNPMSMAKPVDEPAQEGAAGREEAQTDWDFYGGDAQALWDAVVQDFQAGAIGVRDPWDADGEEPERCITLYAASETSALDSGDETNRGAGTITGPDTAERTLAALAALGARL